MSTTFTPSTPPSSLSTRWSARVVPSFASRATDANAITSKTAAPAYIENAPPISNAADQTTLLALPASTPAVATAPCALAWSAGGANRCAVATPIAQLSPSVTQVGGVSGSAGQRVSQRVSA